MKLKMLVAAAALAAATLVSSAASAAITYVGSWQVDQGPSWTTVPSAYTGQQAAALLFGGAASGYMISTVDNTVANINRKSWVSVWFAGSFPDCSGFPCGRQVADNSVTSTGGLYQNPGDESAYVRDWAIGAQFTNYAFTGSAAPEPAAWGLMISGFGMAGAMIRRRKVVAA